MGDQFFWDMLPVVIMANGPLQHHMALMTKKVSPAQLDLEGSPLCQLVCGKGQEIFDDLADMLFEAEWARDINDIRLIELAVDVASLHVAGYKRRVMDVVGTSPWPLNRL